MRRRDEAASSNEFSAIFDAGRRSRRADVLLIDLPFSALETPSLALESLRAALECAGLACAVIYPKYAFARRIGVEAYRYIAHEASPAELIGDRVFAEALHGDGVRPPVEARPGPTDGSCVDQMMPSLSHFAAAFTGDLAQQIASVRPRIVGLSTTYNLAPALALARHIKLLDAEIRVVLGGAYCDGTSGAALLTHFSWVDFICCGEGEVVFPALAQSLLTSVGEVRLPGIGCRAADGKVECAERAPLITDLDQLPVPDFGTWLEAVQQYCDVLSPDHRALVIETSRGCWYGMKHHCTFCGLNGTSMEYRAKSAGRVFEELAAFESASIRNVISTDLILDMRYFKTLLPRLAGNTAHSFYFEVKANLDDEQVALLGACGIRTIQPGIESLSTPILKLMRKGVTAGQNLRLLRMCVENRVSPRWNLLYGFPGEDGREYQRMAEMVPYLMHLPPPSTPLHRVRLDRYSPLYESEIASAPAAVRPAASYARVFRLPDDVCASFAYYFERAAPVEYSDEGVTELRRAVEVWRSCHADRYFVAIPEADGITVFDGRQVAPRRVVRLEGLQARVFLAARKPTRAARCAADFGVEPHLVEQAMRELVEARLLIRVDDCCINVAVLVPTWRDLLTHTELDEAIVATLYRRRIALRQGAGSDTDSQASRPRAHEVRQVPHADRRAINAFGAA